MSQKSSKILKVYELCEQIISRKRDYISSICFPSLKQNQFQNNICDFKEYCSCYFFKIAISKFFSQAAMYFTIFKDSSKDNSVFKQIQSNIQIIKNKKELSTRHQIIQSQLSGLKTKFQSEEAIIFYQINQRVKLKNSMIEKLKIYKQCLENIKSMKNPHHNYQLINKLKKNLQAITTQDRNYDIQNEEKSIKIHKCLKDLAKSMELSIESIQCKSFIFMQKKKLFSQFLQVHQGKNGKQRQNLINNYMVKLLITSQEIIKYLKNYIGFTENLIKYFQDLRKKLDYQIKKNEKEFQQFFQTVTQKNKQIGSFLRTDVPQKINNNVKAVLHIRQLLRGFPDWLGQTKRYLVEFLSQSVKYHQKYMILHQKHRQVDSFQKILIQHKGNFSNLQKKQDMLNRRSIQNLRKFVRDLHELLKTIYQQNVKTSNLREQLDIHEILNKIFAEYDCQQPNLDTQDSEFRKKEKMVSSDMNQKINEYQKYIDSIQIFDLRQLDWKKNYYSCSLGPRLLIHGYLQNLQQGIYYQSSFNKKNYFFGKTKLFIPKKDIYQINKQIVLLVFSDVLQVKTNKGNIYFHALGKRQKMYDAFIQTYFPQLPQSQELISGDSPELDFYEYKGQDTSSKNAYAIKHYPIDYGKSTLKNADLRIIYRRYLSDDQFVHQGKHYPNFKHYQLQLINCFDVVTNQTTPPPPYYFMKKGEVANFDSVPDYSVRIATSSKKVPSIPFLSKGGVAFTEQKSKMYWASPSFLVVDIENRMKGFSLTDGMTVRLRCFYQQNSSGQVVCSMSGDITFQNQGAFNGTIKHIAMGQLQASVKVVNEAMLKFQKNRNIYKNKGIKVGKEVDQQKEQFKDQIQKLKHQNKKLKTRNKYQLFFFAAIYLITFLIFKFQIFDIPTLE